MRWKGKREIELEFVCMHDARVIKKAIFSSLETRLRNYIHEQYEHHLPIQSSNFPSELSTHTHTQVKSQERDRVACV